MIARGVLPTASLGDPGQEANEETHMRNEKRQSIRDDLKPVVLGTVSSPRRDETGLVMLTGADEMLPKWEDLPPGSPTWTRT